MDSTTRSILISAAIAVADQARCLIVKTPDEDLPSVMPCFLSLCRCAGEMFDLIDHATPMPSRADAGRDAAAAAAARAAPHVQPKK